MGILYGWWRKSEEPTPLNLRDVLDDILVAHAEAEHRRYLNKIESQIATTVDKALGVLYPIEDIEYVPPGFGLYSSYGDYYSFKMAGATWRYSPIEQGPDILWVVTPNESVYVIENPIDLYRALEQ